MYGSYFICLKKMHQSLMHNMSFKLFTSLFSCGKQNPYTESLRDYSNHCVVKKARARTHTHSHVYVYACVFLSLHILLKSLTQRYYSIVSRRYIICTHLCPLYVYISAYWLYFSCKQINEYFVLGKKKLIICEYNLSTDKWN